MNEQVIRPAGRSVEPQRVISSASTLPRGFVTRVAWTLATRLAMVAGSIGASILVARWLGAKGLGQFAVVNVTLALALQIGSAGLPSAMIYSVAKDRQRLATQASNALLFAIVIGSALALAVIALASLNPAVFGYVPLRLMAIGSVSLPFLLITLLGLNLLLAIDRVAQFNLLDGAAPLLVLLNAVFVLIILGSGLFALVALNTVAAVLISAATIALIMRAIRQSVDRPRWYPDVSMFKLMASYAIKFYISIVAGMIIIRADLLIVNHFRGQAEAGVYAVASQVATLLMLLPGVIATLLFPHVASSDDQRGVFAMRVTRHTSFLLAIICVLTVPVAFVIPLIYGSPFADATIQLFILLPGVYCIGLESVLVQYFTGTGLPAAIPAFWGITVVVSVGLNLMLVPGFGARAAAINSTISYALIFVLVTYYFRLKTGNRLSEVLLLHRNELRDLFAAARSRPSSERT